MFSCSVSCDLIKESLLYWRGRKEPRVTPGDPLCDLCLRGVIRPGAWRTSHGSHAAHMTYRMVQSQLEAEIFESWMTHTGLAQNSLGSGRIFFLVWSFHTCSHGWKQNFQKSLDLNKGFVEK